MEEVGAPLDSAGARDLRKQHTPELHLRPIGDTGKYFKPHPPYSLTVRERSRFINRVASIKTPKGYAGQLGKHLGQK